MRSKRRFFLVAMLVVTQAACLGLGVLWATGWLWNAFEEVVHDHVAAEGAAQSHDFAVKAVALGLQNVEPGSQDWKQLQRLCEEAAIPHDGFVCVFRRDNGAMLCHPNLEHDPGLLRLFPGRGFLRGSHGSAPITQLIAESDPINSPVVEGKVDLDGQMHVFAGYSLPELNVVIAVYQSDISIDLFIASVIRPIMQVGYALMAFVVGGTAIVTVFLINRYEAGLAEINARLEEQVSERTKSLVKTRNAVIFGLAKLAESRDRDTTGHLERIRAYVTILATELAKVNPTIDHRFVADLAIASSLHDIGKVGVPDAVLLKEGALTSTERRAMEFHTILGSECLAAIQSQLDEDRFLDLAQKIAVGHHEHWDGNGYPHGIQGKEIPLAARIVAIADVYDALTSSRPHKKAPVTHAEAREWIATRYATHFDPAIVEAFIAREKDFIKVSQTKRNPSENSESANTLPEIDDEQSDVVSLQAE